jgi:hypothetical protein
MATLQRQTDGSLNPPWLMPMTVTISCGAALYTPPWKSGCLSPSGRSVRESINEAQYPEPRFDTVRDGDPGRELGCHPWPGFVGRGGATTAQRHDHLHPSVHGSIDTGQGLFDPL